MNREQYYQIGKYVQDEVRKIAKRTENFDPESLCGGCAIAAVAVNSILGRLNVTSCVIETQYENDNEWGFCHCWCETPRFVIDPTAVQFNKRQSRSWPDVIVMLRQDYYCLHMFPKKRTYARGQDALNNISAWYYYQNPKSCAKDLDVVIEKGVRKFQKRL